MARSESVALDDFIIFCSNQKIAQTERKSMAYKLLQFQPVAKSSFCNLGQIKIKVRFRGHGQKKEGR